METPYSSPPTPAHLVDAALRHAQEVIDQVFEVAASCDADLSLQRRPSAVSLATLKELAFDVAVANDGLSRHVPVPERDAALRAEALQGLQDARTVLSHLIEAEEVAIERLASSRRSDAPDSTARRA